MKANRQIDTEADTYGFHPSLLIPIAAKSIEAIVKYVGEIEESLDNDNGFFVSFSPLAKPNDLKVWEHERSFLLNCPKQLWVNVDSRNYRKQYQKYFESQIKDKQYVVDHIMNRKLARRLGYKYVRLLHSSASNSSGGRGGETFGNKFVEKSESWNTQINNRSIVYADLWTC